ncbi:MAG: thiamine pyrophosphate-dependent enzyme [Chloroflexota bacterium]
MPEVALAKDPGAAKELHEADLAATALPVLDIDAYVEDFGRAVVPGYRRGIADAEFPADAGLARSIIPPGTSATRDFSRLAPRIPDVLMDKCVGCMACVNACPDSAILACVVQESQVAPSVETFAAGQPQPAVAAAELTRHFAATQKYGDVPAKRGEERGAFGLFVDPGHCKGCAECVDVCAALGHDALIMIEKVEDEPASGESTLERYGRDIAFFRSLPPTPAVYRNEKALADIMLGEHALGYVGGAGSCAGCGEATALRMLVAATRQIHGPQSMGIVAATGCNTVFGSTYPFNPYLVPWTNSLFENAPAVALGIRARWDQAGHTDRRLWVVGGDGAMYDIGFQALSRMFASGMNIKVFVLDTQVYSNTGGQASTASFTGQNTKMSVHGNVFGGKQERRKEIAQIAMMHPRVYVAQTTCAHVNHFYKSVLGALEFDGPAVVVCYTTCQPEHGVGDNMAGEQARLAVDTRAFPLLIYDPRAGETVKSRLSLMGNPNMKGDWFVNPKTKEEVSFIDFARSEGRFSKHFDKDGNPSETLLAAKLDRLENWRLLQELAGLR